MKGEDGQRLTYARGHVTLNQPIKAIGHFRYRTKLKVHRLTHNLQGLQKVMVKDFSWNIIPWNALLFEKTLKQYQFSISRITDLFETHVMTRRNVRKQGWVFPLFSSDSDDWLSLNFHRFVILYISCDTRSVGLGHILFTESVQWLQAAITHQACNLKPINNI